MYIPFHGAGGARDKGFDHLFHDVCNAEPRGWFHKLSAAVKANNMRLRHAVNDEHGLLSTHVSCFADATLIKLAKKMGMPRGCVLIFDVKAKTLLSVGSFYPKFANDDRQQRDTKIYSEGVDKISFFVKYSGSLGIVTLFEHNGQLCYTTSSKNSCNTDKPPDRPAFPVKVNDVAKDYMTQSHLEQLKQRGIQSVCGEFFWADDASHGYSYNKSGFICTSMARLSESGQPAYLPPQELGETCDSVGVPTDMPLVLTDRKKAYEFMAALSRYRNVMTLTLLEKISSELGVETMRHHHRELIKGDIIEGFVIRRWKGDTELPTIKFKCWLYQMITQCVRKYFKGNTNAGVLDYRKPLIPIRNANGVIAPGYLKNVEKAMKYWCVIAPGDTQMAGVCRWLLFEVARLSKASDEPLQWRDEFQEAYWALLGRQVCDKFVKLMVEVDWDIRKLTIDLPPAPKNGAAFTVKAGDAVMLIPIGVPGIGKSTVLRSLAGCYEPGTVFYATQDDHKDAKQFYSKMKKQLDKKKGKPRVLIVDRNNHREFHRNDLAKVFGDDFPKVYLNFVPEDEQGLNEIAEIAIERQKARGAQHQNLRDPAYGKTVIKRFVDEFEELDTSDPTLNVPPLAPVDAKVAMIAQFLQQLQILPAAPSHEKIAAQVAETQKYQAGLGAAAVPMEDRIEVDDEGVNRLQDLCLAQHVAFKDAYSLVIAEYHAADGSGAPVAPKEVQAELAQHLGAPIRGKVVALHKGARGVVAVAHLDAGSTTPRLPFPDTQPFPFVVFSDKKIGHTKVIEEVLKTGDGIPLPDSGLPFAGHLSRRYV